MRQRRPPGSTRSGVTHDVVELDVGQRAGEVDRRAVAQPHAGLVGVEQEPRLPGRRRGAEQQVRAWRRRREPGRPGRAPAAPRRPTGVAVTVPDPSATATAAAPAASAGSSPSPPARRRAGRAPARRAGSAVIGPGTSASVTCSSAAARSAAEPPAPPALLGQRDGEDAEAGEVRPVPRPRRRRSAPGAWLERRARWRAVLGLGGPLPDRLLEGPLLGGDGDRHRPSSPRRRSDSVKIRTRSTSCAPARPHSTPAGGCRHEVRMGSSPA